MNFVNASFMKPSPLFVVKVSFKNVSCFVSKLLMVDPMTYLRVMNTSRHKKMSTNYHPTQTVGLDM
jgi:hypothetical protein